MKKIFGFFIAFMLVASVIALAEEEADDSRRDYAGKRLNEVSDDKRIELRKQEESKVLRHHLMQSWWMIWAECQLRLGLPERFFGGGLWERWERIIIKWQRGRICLRI